MSLISLETKIRFNAEELKVYRRYLESELKVVNDLIQQKEPEEVKFTCIKLIRNEVVAKNPLNAIAAMRKFAKFTDDSDLLLREGKRIIDILFVEGYFIYEFKKPHNEQEIKHSPLNIFTLEIVNS